MSSAVGHCVAAICVGEGTREPSDRLRFAWAAWLCVVACAPDADYALEAMGVHLSARFTHSITGALALPAFTIAGLAFWRKAFPTRMATAAILAGLSHLALDLCAGVTRLPLLWPFSSETFVLPFGILPSAGAVELTNALLYRNLLIEQGVLAPLAVSLFLMRRGRYRAAAACGAFSAPFIIWAFQLVR